MGTEQQFCLRWNNHQGNMVSVFDTLLKNNLLVDVTLACEGSTLKAHKVVLSACSPFFQDIFVNNPCKHPVIVMNGIKISEMKALMQFMYKGEINVSQDQLAALLRTAESLKIKGLAEGDHQTQEDSGSGHQNTDDIAKAPPVQQPQQTFSSNNFENVCTEQPQTTSFQNVPSIRRRRQRRSMDLQMPPMQSKTPKMTEEHQTLHENVDTNQREMYAQPENYEQSPSSQQMSVPYSSDSTSNEPVIVNIKPDPDPPMSNNAPVPEFIDSAVGSADMTGDEHIKDSSHARDDISDSFSFHDPGSSDAMYQDQGDLSMMSSMQFDAQGDGNSSDMMYMEPGTSSGAADKSSSEMEQGYVIGYSDTLGRCYVCTVCQKKIKRKSEMIRHFNGVHAGARFQCNMCRASYSMPNNLTTHKRLIHGTSRS